MICTAENRMSEYRYTAKKRMSRMGGMVKYEGKSRTTG